MRAVRSSRSSRFQRPSCSPHQVQARFGQLQPGDIQPSPHQRRQAHHRRHLRRAQHGLRAECRVFVDDQIFQIESRSAEEIEDEPNQSPPDAPPPGSWNSQCAPSDAKRPDAPETEPAESQPPRSQPAAWKRKLHRTTLQASPPPRLIKEVQHHMRQEANPIAHAGLACTDPPASQTTSK